MTTQAEQEMDLEDARVYVALKGLPLTLNRCRHESCDRTALWAFGRDSAAQRGSISQVPHAYYPDYAWKCSRMFGGMPVSEKYYSTLEAALDDIADYVRAAP